jgi:hypothetical protein
MDWGFELPDKGVDVDGENGRDVRGLVCSDEDCTELERVDGGGAGMLEAEDEELVVDTPVVVDGRWPVDVEGPITELYLVEQSFDCRSEQSFAGSAEESLADRVDKSLGGTVNESFVVEVQSFQTTDESFAGQIESFQGTDESFAGKLESFVGMVVMLVEVVPIEVPVNEDSVMIWWRLPSTWKGDLLVSELSEDAELAVV